MSEGKRGPGNLECQKTAAKKLKLGPKEDIEQVRSRLIMILEREINTEVNSLKEDLDTIEDRIFQTRQYLLKVRQGVVSDCYRQNNKDGLLQKPFHPSVRKTLRGKEPSTSFKSDKEECDGYLEESTSSKPTSADEQGYSSDEQSKENNFVNSLDEKSSDETPSSGTEPVPPPPVSKLQPRHVPPKPLEGVPKPLTFRDVTKRKKIRIVVGNVSKWLDQEAQSATHKWTVYIKSLEPDFELSSIVSKVKFFLHPSYKPNDVIQVVSPPYKLTRRGWGEFPLRIQFYFLNEALNKPVDVIHNIKLDTSHTGFETFGRETVADIWLHLESENVEEKKSEEETIITHDIHLLSDPFIFEQPSSKNNIQLSNILDGGLEDMSLYKECSVDNSMLDSFFKDIGIKEDVVKSSVDVVAPSNSDIIAPSSLDKVTPSSTDKIVPSSTDKVVPGSFDVIAPSSSDVVAPCSPGVGALSSLDITVPSDSDIVTPSSLKESEISSKLELKQEIEIKQEVESVCDSNTDQESLSDYHFENCSTETVIKCVDNNTPTIDIQKENGSPTISGEESNGTASTSNPPGVGKLRGEIQQRKLLVRMQNGEVKEINARVLIVPKNTVKTVTPPKAPVIHQTVPVKPGQSPGAQSRLKMVPIEKLTKPLPSKYVPQGPVRSSAQSKTVQIPRQLVINEPMSISVKGTAPKINLLPQSSKQAGLVRTIQPQNNIELLTVQNRTQVLNVISKSATNSITVQGDRKNVILKPSPSSKAVIIQKKIVPGVSLLKKPEIKQDVANKPEPKLINRPLDSCVKNCPIQDIESAVSWLVKRYPVVDRRACFEAFRTKHPYCAKDRVTFLSWPLPKQRAAERCRAKSVVSALEKLFPGVQVWSVFEVLKWAQARAYTPLPITTKYDALPVFTPDVEFKFTPFPEISKLLEKCRKQEIEEEVDIMTVDDKKVENVEEVSFRDVLGKGGCVIPLEAELIDLGEFVDRECEKFRAVLGGEEIIPGVFYPASLRLMISVFSSFAEDLIRRSHEAGWKRYNECVPPCIEEVDVKSAILSREEFDLFTNEGLGASDTSLVLAGPFQYQQMLRDIQAASAAKKLKEQNKSGAV